MKEIKCNECGKFLFETDRENNGAIGAEAQERGFVYKNACLFSKDYGSLYFCNNDCGKSFYQKNIPSNPEVTKAIEGLKRDIPQMAKQVSKKMAGLTDKLRANGLIK